MSNVIADVKRTIVEETEIRITRVQLMDMIRGYLEKNTFQVKEIPQTSYDFSMTYNDLPFMDEFNEPIKIRWVTKRNMDTGGEL